MKRNSCRNYADKRPLPHPLVPWAGRAIMLVWRQEKDSSRTFRAQQHVVSYYDTGWPHVSIKYGIHAFLYCDLFSISDQCKQICMDSIKVFLNSFFFSKSFAVDFFLKSFVWPFLSSSSLPEHPSTQERVEQRAKRRLPPKHAFLLLYRMLVRRCLVLNIHTKK